MFDSPTKRSLTENRFAQRQAWSPVRSDVDEETANKLSVREPCLPGSTGPLLSPSLHGRLRDLFCLSISANIGRRARQSAYGLLWPMALSLSLATR